MSVSPFSSLRVQVIIIIALLIIAPAFLVGGAGIIYYRDVIRNNIGDDNLAQAKAIAALTTNYVDLSENYLKSIATRPQVIGALQERNASHLNYTAWYASAEGLQFDSVFITDASGIVLSYQSLASAHPYAGEVGTDYSSVPYVREVLATSEPYVSDGMKDVIDGSTTVYVGVPITGYNDTTVGAMVGSLDLANYTSIVVGTQVKNRQYIFLVNRTGHVMLHGNHSYMDHMTDFSVLPAVRAVISGHEGYTEQAFPFENDVRLVAYAPVAKYGWGVVVSLPVDLAYQPIADFTRYFLALLVVLLIIAAILSVLLGNYITDPLLRLSRATAIIPEGDPGQIEKSLPLGRRDEIGNLARAFLAMANIIKSDRGHIISARDQAEEEKQRSDLYVDIMGHDINNLNQSALGNLEMVRTGDNLTKGQNEMLDTAIRSIQSSAGIIDSVRKLQKIAGEEPGMEKVDIDTMIQECIKEASWPEDKRVTIRYIPEKGKYVTGTLLLKEVFCNLIGNSIKYSGQSVDIEITVRAGVHDGRKVYEAAVSDNGYGIPDETKQKLFRRFQRGTTQAYGKGLGLYIVKKLLDRSGGSIGMRDRVPGDYEKGTVFIVTLPACDDRLA